MDLLITPEFFSVAFRMAHAVKSISLILIFFDLLLFTAVYIAYLLSDLLVWLLRKVGGANHDKMKKETIETEETQPERHQATTSDINMRKLHETPKPVFAEPSWPRFRRGNMSGITGKRKRDWRDTSDSWRHWNPEDMEEASFEICEN